MNLQTHDSRSVKTSSQALQGSSQASSQVPADSSSPVYEVMADGFGLDATVPRTFLALLRRPAAVAAAYQTEGQRRFASPFKYILIAAAVATFLGALVVDMD